MTVNDHILTAIRQYAYLGYTYSDTLSTMPQRPHTRRR